MFPFAHATHPLSNPHTQRLNRLLELYRSMPEPLKPRQRRQLAPEALADAVRPEGLAAALEKLGRRKVAVVVEPPEALRGACGVVGDGRGMGSGWMTGWWYGASLQRAGC